ncbi:hypothetical protein EJ05DRAFT_45020 [Pseudovirgaria hyperparasitica]|uniref:Galactosyl transferase GMA12/MNN10 family protein n=1 Tax=Pseudovirgaria hyperparasitica TaxID=470096 RepID=A0A6A6W1N1_9PEZI|nr:uncharacterized protein EJ05DRAFT_45020 [Pseudovirgaria hyperparasitica]KAF2756828.1 hypothetical protein EJ05DRAFT_45020 [Pseudovirgaria hyperparasitica]
MLYGPYNEMYERAIESHTPHNELHGYDMFVLRHQITEGYWNKLLHLQTIIANELQKDLEGRLDWIWWVDPAIIIINPAIPLDIFLPPPHEQFAQTSFLATHTQGALNTTSFFIKVSPWSIRFLVKAMATPFTDTNMDLLANIDAQAMATALNDTGFRDSVFYQNIEWYNNKIGDDLVFHGDLGSLCIVFPPELEGARWKAMSDSFGIIEWNKDKLPVPLSHTGYMGAMDHYWGQIMDARIRLHEAETMIARLGVDNAPEELKKAVGGMKDAISFQPDRDEAMREAIERMKWHMNLVKPPKGQ